MGEALGVAAKIRDARMWAHTCGHTYVKHMQAHTYVHVCTHTYAHTHVGGAAAPLLAYQSGMGEVCYAAAAVQQPAAQHSPRRAQMTYTMRQRLSNYMKPDTDPFMGLPYSRTWNFLTDAYIAYDDCRYHSVGGDRGKWHPLVVMAQLWVTVAQRIHAKWGQSDPYKREVREATCNYCGDTDAQSLIIHSVCADCHTELNA
jgi:hypothetical protein